MYLFLSVDAHLEAGLYLCQPQSGQITQQKTWLTERNLAETLLAQILDFLKLHNLDWSDLRGLGVFAGPAGFTDLRVVHTVANTLAYSLQLPIVNHASHDWQQICWQKLKQKINFKIIKPYYGRPPRITKRRK